MIDLATQEIPEKVKAILRLTGETERLEIERLVKELTLEEFRLAHDLLSIASTHRLTATATAPGTAKLVMPVLKLKKI